ncbi:glycosyltransferase family 2 protein [Salinibacterium sp. SWN167]|uniref:glycosyltransferase family 2 protein n=1 Tax=Salinibacterium sp. SWN167 TaxID=2792054 RepID=UPI0018CF2962|nr:glycosyltransferase family 2 protein [Salinibacterium sp. SWN167]MBH0082865.1 glycosyltransferase family 2 protein [Salinibacterium sp. SWN167]
MQPRVTAVLVARNGAKYLPRTLAAIAAQSRRPDSVIVVDAESSDESLALMADSAPAQIADAHAHKTFGGAIGAALYTAAPQATENEWLWLLAHDSAPDPNALRALLGAVEIAPSVAVAGPKLVRWDDPSVISNFGETLTPLGRSVGLVNDELDQAQHDVQTDAMGVAGAGMLVRRQVWTALGGFDPKLTSVDAALDFCIRARLAGHRVVAVADARVASSGGPELFGKRSISAAAHNRVQRFAQLHRRLVYAPALAVPLHWLTLLPLAILRSLGHLVAKRPTAIAGEFAAAFAAIFDGGVVAARRNLRRNKQVGFAAVDPLRMSWAELREVRAHERQGAAPDAAFEVERPKFFGNGGAWVVLLAGILGMVSFSRFVDAVALTGGGLLPLSTTVSELWAHVGYGWNDLAQEVVAADPFAAVLAILGSLTFWNPSFSIVMLYLLALPLAALAAWLCAAAISERTWAPTLAAVAWTVAPSFLIALGEGQLGAVLAHILLPWLILTALRAAHNWAMAALAALLFAVITASAPSLIPALLIGLVAWIVLRPKSTHRLIWIVIPAAALFAPLVIQQWGRGALLAIFADPGLPVAREASSGWQLAIGSVVPGTNGWSELLSTLGLNDRYGPLLVALLLAPFAALALMSLFVPGTRRAVPSLALALLGFATAVAATHLTVSASGESEVTVWAGAGLSLYWLGLSGAVIVAIDSLGRHAALPAVVALIGILGIAAAPLWSLASGAVPVTTSNGRLLPAFVAAESTQRDGLGTLQITVTSDSTIAVDLHRGRGSGLDEQSTLAATSTELSDAELVNATLAGNIASRSGYAIADELNDLQIAFIVLTPATDSDTAETRQRIIEALDGNSILNPIGDTAQGYLWHYPELREAEIPVGASNTETNWGQIVLTGQVVVFGLTLLLAIPTTRRRRLKAAKAESAVTVIEANQ